MFPLFSDISTNVAKTKHKSNRRQVKSKMKTQSAKTWKHIVIGSCALSFLNKFSKQTLIGCTRRKNAEEFFVLQFPIISVKTSIGYSEIKEVLNEAIQLINEPTEGTGKLLVDQILIDPTAAEKKANLTSFGK